MLNASAGSAQTLKAYCHAGKRCFLYEHAAICVETHLPLYPDLLQASRVGVWLDLGM